MRALVLGSCLAAVLYAALIAASVVSAAESALVFFGLLR